MPDAAFADPRLAPLYDPLDPDRSDLDHYVALVEELGARSVLDVGCGTGTFACLLASRGIEVVGVDPAAASLDVARGKPCAHQVRWVHGDATTLPPLRVDLASMTGNVAQVFVGDDEWAATLDGLARAVRPEGHLVLESRVPERRAWLEWDRERTYDVTELDGVGRVETWTDVTEVAGDVVSFRSTYVLGAARTVLTSESTLRFRTLEQLVGSLDRAGFVVDDVRDAPDRPGREMVLVAHRSTT
ncbi:class I SAM-dependent methyltransferase [Actinotalea ferrariae]|uniref:class I SAM-dependent methyltransferase n=1 Tax=Actinotalea ferrariae TaxID=1386098 RepID=UPI001C8BF6A1|nr:class I SAM-dependent methyltransferase [Actinotalea ferrariae]MBX9244174.1 class I SAM-dependent methyltransferase [Actinotalea ferrariae]